MGDRTFVYVDGESHFIRSERTWRTLHGKGASLENLRYIGDTNRLTVLVEQRAKVFWTRRMQPGCDRVLYYTSAVGDDQFMHDTRVALREFGMEPCVIRERKTLAKQRRNRLGMECLIEKPKGVDIALAIRVVEDAYNDFFDTCHLYTSDADFVPVIETVKRRGKSVWVHGYRDGLSDRSELLHVPDGFNDLAEMLRDRCEPVPESAG